VDNVLGINIIYRMFDSKHLKKTRPQLLGDATPFNELFLLIQTFVHIYNPL